MVLLEPRGASLIDCTVMAMVRGVRSVSLPPPPLSWTWKGKLKLGAPEVCCELAFAAGMNLSLLGASRSVAGTVMVVLAGTLVGPPFVAPVQTIVPTLAAGVVMMTF